MSLQASVQDRNMANRGAPQSFSLGKVASYCGVTRKTVLRWVQGGMLNSFTLPSGHHRVLPDEITRFLREHNMPVPEELNIILSKSVLICDDDLQIRRLIVELLKPYFIVHEAGDGVEACIKLGELHPDLLLLDIRMPKMNGLEVCYYIKNDSKLANTRIIIVSGFAEEDLPRSLRNIVEAVVDKPFLNAYLLQTCREAVGWD